MQIKTTKISSGGDTDESANVCISKYLPLYMVQYVITYCYADILDCFYNYSHSFLTLMPLIT